jgi:GBP family porin
MKLEEETLMKSTMFLSRLAPLAVAALAATGANAQTAAPSSVTLYGLVDACVVSHRSANGAKVQVNGGGCFYGSRFGLRGNEDLGGGLRAYFGLESGFAIDTGNSGQGGRLFGRRSTVGLGSSALGAIELGRELPPGHFLISNVDPQQLGIGSASNTLWTGAPGPASGRVDNGLMYVSPDMGGVTARLLYAPGEQAAPAASRGGDTKGLNVTYRSKTLLAGLAYANVRNAAANADDSATTLGVKYDFGAFSLAGLAQFGAWEGTRTVAAPSSATALYSRDYRSYVVGGTVKLGTGSLSGTYKRYDDRTASNFDARVVSATYIHPLSKRTQLYTGFSHTKNLRASSYGVADGNGTYAGTAPGGTARIIDLGITHFF